MKPERHLHRTKGKSFGMVEAVLEVLYATCYPSMKAKRLKNGFSTSMRTETEDESISNLPPKDLPVARRALLLKIPKKDKLLAPAMSNRELRLGKPWQPRK